MRRQLLVTALFVTAQILAVSDSPRVEAQDASESNAATPAQDAALKTPDTASPSSAGSSVAEQPAAPAEAPSIEPAVAPVAAPAPTADAVPADPVVAAIRTKLSDQAVVPDCGMRRR